MFKTRRLLPVILLAAVSLQCGRESESQSGKERPRDTEVQAEILKMKEPAAKLAAYRKFLADFPESEWTAPVRRRIFDILTRNFPERKQEILQQAEEIVATESHPGTAAGVARRLMEAGLFESAERLAREAVAIDLPTYRRRVMESSGGRASPPSEQELLKEYRKARATYAATLGQILLKRGSHQEGEELLRQALEEGAELSSGQLFNLGEISQRQGDRGAALDFMMRAAITGRLETEERAKLQALYAERHGSASDLEAVLDEKYRQTYPNPVKTGTRQPLKSRTARTVLAEIFTGAGCPPCVGANLALEAAMETYGRDELVVLMYHLHIPRPDPLANPSTINRGRSYGVRSVPTVRVDGVEAVKEGGSRSESQEVFNQIKPVIEERLTVKEQANLSVEAVLEGTVVRVRAGVRNLQHKGDLRLHLALVEEQVRYSGENGMRFHSMVVRSLAGADGSGLPITGESDIEYSFDLAQMSATLKSYLEDYEQNGDHGKISFSEKKSQVGPGGLAVAAFVQNDGDRSVLQSVIRPVRGR